MAACCPRTKPHITAAQNGSPAGVLGAAAEYEKAEQILRDGGFPAHAVIYTYERAAALAAGGSTDAAVDLLFERLWDSVRQGDPDTAKQMAARIEGLVTGQPQRGQDSDKLLRWFLTRKVSDSEAAPEEPTTDNAPPELSGTTRALAEAASVTVGLLTAGVAGLEPAAALLNSAEVPFKAAARVGVLAAETAVAEHSLEWIGEHSERLAVIATGLPAEHQPEALRLQLCLADVSNEWSTLVGHARTRQVPRGLCALIFGRHARHLALSGQWQEAWNAWAEAIEQGCLDGSNREAAGWQRSFAQIKIQAGVLPGPHDERLARALESMSDSREPIIAYGSSSREQGIEGVLRGDLQRAITALRGYLRVSVAAGRWDDEFDARALLADAYVKAADLNNAAAHLISAGQAKQLREELSPAGRDQFIDVTDRLGPGPYWERASAFELLASQADLMPDNMVQDAASAALDALDGLAAGLVPDSRHFEPLLFVAAPKFLAAVADRLPENQAQRLLDHLRPLAPRDPDRYRYTDEAHAAACVRVATAHPELRTDALGQLVELIKGEVHDAERHARALMPQYGQQIRPQLLDLAAAGNRSAAQLLLHINDADEEGLFERAQQAAERLKAPLVKWPD